MYRVVIGGIFLWSLFILEAQAASLYMDPGTATISRGDAIEVAIRLDTDEETGECVNAVSGVINYDPGLVPVDTSVGNSIFRVWVEDPVIDQENSQITFAGGIPNGYCGRIQGDPRLTNTILTLIFRAPGFQVGGSGSDDAVVSVSFDPSTTAYLNDGLGTKANLRLLDARITVNDNAGGQVQDPWREEVRADRTPPVEFSIALERDPLAFSNKYFIVFSTTDKQTGIAYYEVMEEPLSDQNLFSWGAVDAPWVRARSPYVLEDQTLSSTIRVRAVDKAGNEYVATLVPDAELRGVNYGNFAMYVVGTAGVLVLLVVIGILIRRTWKKRVETVENDEYESE